LLAGQEHGRTIPSADATPLAWRQCAARVDPAWVARRSFWRPIFRALLPFAMKTPRRSRFDWITKVLNDIVLHCNGRIDEMRAVDLAELQKTFAALLAGGQTAGARMVLS
jgi:hypothetical protein